MEGASKAGAVVVGGVAGAIGDVDIVAAVTAVPLQGVLLVVLDGQVGAVPDVQLVVFAEVDGMDVAGCAGAVHRHVGVIQGQGGILAGANGRPVPFCGVGWGADVIQHHLHILEGQGLAPQGDALVLKDQLGLLGGLHHIALSVLLFGGACNALNGQVFVEVDALGGGLGLDDLDGGTIGSLLNGLVDTVICSGSDRK